MKIYPNDEQLLAMSIVYQSEECEEKPMTVEMRTMAAMMHVRDICEERRNELLDLLREAKKFGINHLDSCDSLDDDKAVIIGDPGTGPWDTDMEPSPCNCGLSGLLSRIEKMIQP